MNTSEVINSITGWIRDWFDKNGPDCNAIVGMSGGKDSTIVAKLCAEALGKDRVIGVIMPNGMMSDRDDAIAACAEIGIDHIEINIAAAFHAIYYQIETPTTAAKINLPARLRMATLYAVAQSRNGRVANTCNRSEDYIGYSTRWGDSVGDFAPIANYTVTELLHIGKALGLPDTLVYKTPSDGLCGKSDEDNLGFTYGVLDNYILNGECINPAIKAKIDDLHEKNLFKLSMMESCPHYKENNQ